MKASGPIRVLYLIDTLEVGGAERSLLAILPRLRGVDSLICHIYEGDRLREEFSDARIKVRSLNLRGKYAFVHAIRRVLHVVREHRPDLIHATLFRAEVIGRAVSMLTGIPIVGSFVRDPSRRTHETPTMRLKLRALRLLDVCSARRVKHFISNSEAIKRSYCCILGIAPERVTVVPRGRNR